MTCAEVLPSLYRYASLWIYGVLDTFFCLPVILWEGRATPSLRVILFPLLL